MPNAIPPLASVEINRAFFTIETKYLAPTNCRGSRIKVSLPSRDDRQASSFSFSVCYHASTGDAHDHAAQEWFKKFHGKFPAISMWDDVSKIPNKIKLLKVATKTGFFYTITK